MTTGDGKERRAAVDARASGRARRRVVRHRAKRRELSTQDERRLARPLQRDRRQRPRKQERRREHRKQLAELVSVCPMPSVRAVPQRADDGGTSDEGVDIANVGAVLLVLQREAHRLAARDDLWRVRAREDREKPTPNRPTDDASGLPAAILVTCRQSASVNSRPLFDTTILSTDDESAAVCGGRTRARPRLPEFWRSFRGPRTCAVASEDLAHRAA